MRAAIAPTQAAGALGRDGLPVIEGEVIGESATGGPALGQLPVPGVAIAVGGESQDRAHERA